MQQFVSRTIVDDEPVLSLRVSLQDGNRFDMPASPDVDLLELLRRFRLPVKAECRRGCCCGSCHIRIPRRWQRYLPPPSKEESAKLHDMPDADETSRLACQITMSERLHGLEIELQPDSLVAQTYWVAG